MPTIAEGISRAQSTGSEDRKSLRAGIYKGVLIVFGVMAVVLVAFWVITAANTNVDRDHTTDTDYETDGDYVTEDDLACTKPWHPKPISGNPNRPTQINPGGDCVWAVEIPDGYCIMGRRADRVADDRPYGPYCNIEGVEHIETEDDIEWVWSVDQFGRPAEPIINAELRLTPDS